MHQDEINSIDDLLASESFRKWILDKDEQAGIFWTQWIEQHPARIEWVAAAKAIIATLTQHNAPLSQEEISAEAARIQEKIAAGHEPEYDEDIPYHEMEADARQRHRRALWTLSKWATGIAAALVIAISGIYLYFQHEQDRTSANVYTVFMRETKNKSLEYNNNSDSAQRISLSDGSEVVLEKNSRLYYATDFDSGKREAYLTGTAFFEIARNPSRPFIVYTQSIVTKVLGTSFTVHAPDGAGSATVLVKTGKVSVFKIENFTGVVPAALKGVVLTPNQQVVYDIASEQMNRSLAEKPALAKQVTFSFDFEDTPAAEVFAKLQEAYGITILLDEEVLASCTITAALGNEPFYEKLRIICKIINATYTVIDGSVIIDAKGCNK